MKSPWKNFPLVFIIFNLLSRYCVCVCVDDERIISIYELVSRCDHTGVNNPLWSFAFSVLFFFLFFPRRIGSPDGEKRRCAYDAKRNNITMCGDMLDDDEQKKKNQKKKESRKSRLLFNLRLSLASLHLFLWHAHAHNIARSISFSRSVSFTFIKLLLAGVRAPDDKVQAHHSQVERREEKTRLA